MKYEHRIVVEESIGRKLEKGEVVHHRDENKLNNNIDNLKVMSAIDHDRYHTIKRHKKEKCFGKKRN